MSALISPTPSAQLATEAPDATKPAVETPLPTDTPAAPTPRGLQSCFPTKLDWSPVTENPGEVFSMTIDTENVRSEGRLTVSYGRPPDEKDDRYDSDRYNYNLERFAYLWRGNDWLYALYVGGGREGGSGSSELVAYRRPGECDNRLSQDARYNFTPQTVVNYDLPALEPGDYRLCERFSTWELNDNGDGYHTTSNARICRDFAVSS